MSYLSWSDVPVAKRLKWGIKHVFFTNHNYDEVIIPNLKGNNIMSVKTFQQKFAYESSHVTAALLRNCIEWGITQDEVTGGSVMDGLQDHFAIYTGTEKKRATTLLRGGILFINSDHFDHAYMRTPDERTYRESMRWLKNGGLLLRYGLETR